MADRYASFAHSSAGHFVVRRLGLPDPPRLRRYAPDQPDLAGPVLLDGAGRLARPVRAIVDRLEIAPPGSESGPDPDASPNGKTAGKASGGGASGGAVTGDGPAQPRPAALVYDATALTDSAMLRGLYDFFHPVIRSLHPSGRVVVLGTPPELCASVPEATAQRALEGFVRTLGKEVGRGSTAQLVYVAAGAETAIESTLRFLLSGRSAYVSGQVIQVSRPVGAAETAGGVPAPADWRRPFDGRVALVTGAARGIGAAIARVLARDGAEVVCLDVPASGDALAAIANELRGSALQLDLTADDAPTRLADFVAARYGRLDALIHNAGITRDKTLGRMTAAQWDAVLAVNLTGQERVNEVLLDRELLADGSAVVSVASVSGIAGNRGQANYATSKAGVIGLVRALAPALAPRGITVNAVAPGFIETRMTAAMPAVPREVGRRANSLAQGGLPVDVAETVAWLASPGSRGVTGNVVRVCGQSMLGA